MKRSMALCGALLLLAAAQSRGDITIKIPTPEAPRVKASSPAPLPPPPWAVPEGTKPKYTYKYYPDQEVYFDPARALYFLMQGGAWKGVPVLPPAIVLKGAPSVSLPMNDDKPYAYHDEVQKRHQGKKKGHHKGDEKGPPGQSGRDDDDHGKEKHGKGKGKH